MKQNIISASDDKKLAINLKGGIYNKNSSVPLMVKTRRPYLLKRAISASDDKNPNEIKINVFIREDHQDTR